MNLNSQKARRLITAGMNVVAGKAYRGECPICNKRTVFVPIGSWYREDLKCIRCRSSARQRAVANFIQTRVENRTDARVLEAAPVERIARQLRRLFKSYETTHYFPGAEPGAITKGYRNENLEHLTYPDEQFDLIITQDVFEHIANPEKAFREIARVLRPGGRHVFTIPWYPAEKTSTRAYEAHGRVVHILEPEHHGNPVDPEGSLVFTDFGGDLPEMIASITGMQTWHYSEQKRESGIIGNSVIVFCSQKQPDHQPGSHTGCRQPIHQ